MGEWSDRVSSQFSKLLFNPLWRKTHCLIQPIGPNSFPLCMEYQIGLCLFCFMIWQNVHPVL